MKEIAGFGSAQKDCCSAPNLASLTVGQCGYTVECRICKNCGKSALLVLVVGEKEPKWEQVGFPNLARAADYLSALWEVPDVPLDVLSDLTSQMTSWLVPNSAVA